MLRTNLVNDAKINKRNDGRKIYKINMSENSRRLHSCGDKAPAILVVEKKSEVKSCTRIKIYKYRTPANTDI